MARFCGRWGAHVLRAPPGVLGVEIVGQSCHYVGRILSGEKPAEMPVPALTKLVMSVNARAAKTLGLEIPASLMALADEVIE